MLPETFFAFIGYTLCIYLCSRLECKGKIKKDTQKNNKKIIKMKKQTGNVIETLKEKIRQNINSGLYMKSLGTLNYPSFYVAPDESGVQVQQLGDFILKWEHFDEIVKKANELGGKMYREDTIAMNSGKLGEEISHDSMEGFIASELLYIPDGTSVTRRSTYYSGILAWAGIVTLHPSQGKGSYITVNAMFRDL